VGDHTSDSFVEDAGWSAEMEGTMCFVVAGRFAEICMVLELCSEEFSRNVQVLTSDNHDLLSVEQLLGNYRCQTTEEMAFAVDDDDRFECRHCL